MTCYLLHHDESIFPDSHTFRPERWLENPHLDRYMVSFSKGPQHCLGMNLANAELYLMLGRLFRAYGSKEARGEGDLGYLELFETTIGMWRCLQTFSFLCRRRGVKGLGSG